MSQGTRPTRRTTRSALTRLNPSIYHSYEDSDGEEDDGIADGADANGGNAVET